MERQNKLRILEQKQQHTKILEHNETATRQTTSSRTKQNNKLCKQNKDNKPTNCKQLQKAIHRSCPKINTKRKTKNHKEACRKKI